MRKKIAAIRKKSKELLKERTQTIEEKILEAEKRLAQHKEAVRQSLEVKAEITSIQYEQVRSSRFTGSMPSRSGVKLCLVNQKHAPVRRIHWSYASFGSIGRTHLSARLRLPHHFALLFPRPRPFLPQCATNRRLMYLLAAAMVVQALEKVERQKSARELETLDLIKTHQILDRCVHVVGGLGQGGACVQFCACVRERGVRVYPRRTGREMHSAGSRSCSYHACMHLLVRVAQAWVSSFNVC